MKKLFEDSQTMNEGETKMGILGFDGMSLSIKPMDGGPWVVVAIGTNDLLDVTEFGNKRVGYKVD